MEIHCFALICRKRMKQGENDTKRRSSPNVPLNPKPNGIWQRTDGKKRESKQRELRMNRDEVLR
jgi:hypothetical protein